MAEEELKSEKPKPKNSCLSVVDEDDQNADGPSGLHQRQLLSKLVSELELLDGKDKDVVTNDGNKEGEIIKELKNVKRQNIITHCLLTTMIVITLAWQLSEVSLILKIRQGLTNPLKSVGGLIKGFFLGRASEELRKQVSEPPSFPSFKIPELSYLELPGFDTSDEDDDDLNIN